MSRIGDIGTAETKYSKLPALLIEYDEYLDLVEERIAIKGKGLEHANVENAAWQVFYDQKRVELRTVLHFMTLEVERVRGKLYRSLKEGQNFSLGEREINQYINNEDAYLRMKQMQLEVEELYEKYKTVIAAFTTRGYALKNVTELRIAQMEGTII